VEAIDTTNLETLLLQLAKVIEDRDALVKSAGELSARDRTDTIIKQIVDLKLSPEEIIAREMSLLDQIRKQLQDLLNVQYELLTDIKKENEAFERSREVDPLFVERNKVLTALEKSSTHFFALHAQIQSGLIFYANLQVSTVRTCSLVYAST